MSKDFEFKIYEEVPADDHISYRLMEQHEDAPQSITEEQLEDFRVVEKDVTIEKLLEKSRTGSADVVTEKNLNDAKDKFGLTHRNSEAYSGNINKLEEKRLSGKPVEKENYVPASGYAKKLRWWETKSPDDLKIANTLQTIKTAQVNQVPEISEIQDFNDSEVPKDNIDDEYEGEDLYQYLDKVTIANQELIEGTIPELYITLDFDKNFFGSDIELAKRVAYERLTHDKPELKDKITASDIYESMDGSQLVLDVFGEEYASGQSNSGNIQDTNSMQEESKEVNVGGTPMVMGKVTFPIDQAVDKATIVDYINSRHQDFQVTEDSLDDSKMADGEVKYTVSKPMSINASSDYDFPIIIADDKSDVKKN